MKTTSASLRATFGRLDVEVHPDRGALGRAAARVCAHWLRASIAVRGAARVVLSGDPSQEEILATLADARQSRVAVDWSRVTVFQLDEFADLAADDPHSRRHRLGTLLLDRVPVGRFHPLNAARGSAEAECARYAGLLEQHPIDLVCLGLGEQGRLAFNDPLGADFVDGQAVKLVALDAAGRRRLAEKEGFPSADAVPRQALTLTLPALRRARRLCVLAAGSPLATAVRATLHDAVTTACPATMLRLHPTATLHLDSAAAGLALSATSTTGGQASVLRP